MDTGALILLLAAVVAAGFGLYRLRTDGRFVLSDAAGIGPATAAAGSSRTRSLRSEQSKDQDYPAPSASVWSVLAAALPEAVPGERATLVQFSSAFCAPCRTTRTLLADIAAGHAGLRHLEIDAEKHLDLVRRLEVRRTPTTLVLDAEGHEITRAAGAPRRDQVLAVLPAHREQAQ